MSLFTEVKIASVLFSTWFLTAVNRPEMMPMRENLSKRIVDVQQYAGNPKQKLSLSLLGETPYPPTLNKPPHTKKRWKTGRGVFLIETYGKMKA